MSKADANMERDSRNASERSPATSSEALEAPDTQRVIEAFKDMPGRELVEMIGHARRLEKRLRRVAHNIVGPYVGIEEHSERVANALTELDRLQQSAQSERGPIVADLGDVDLSKLDLRPGQIIEVTNEDAERYRWFRDECGYERQMDILEASEGVADMLDHHIDKGRCGL
jgi:hypothetical protein